MNILQTNNSTPSFGINVIKMGGVVPEYTKKVWEKATKKIAPEEMTKVFEEIKNIKPKVGPDIDTYIGVHSRDMGNIGIHLGVGTFLHIGAANLEGIIQDISAGFSRFFPTESPEVTPKSLINGFKKLVKSVEKERLSKLD